MFRSKTLPQALALTLALFMGTTVADEIYRHVDDNGNVTYSDEPMTDDSQAMDLNPLPEVSLPDASQQKERGSRNETASDSGNAAPQAQGYQSIEITQPEHDSAFWRGDGRVVVRFQSQPALRAGHRYALEVDGERIQKSRRNTFSLKNVNRGTHELVVHVVDGNGETVNASDVTRFTLHRPSQQN
ncbi:DUF4124 domain-containing protein [Salicola sp. Rm-C-2C1-2]|uniref:DUF4124 domain-containing protein n=1 Tax=Salicola sp. Rm-C-2C1-2 TaxID=3141321 RepID=UPI0032E3E153